MNAGVCLALLAACLGPVAQLHGDVIDGPLVIDPPDSAYLCAEGRTLYLHQVAFNERQGVVLPVDVEIDPGGVCCEPGGGCCDPSGVLLPAGTVVNSHMIYLDTCGADIEDHDVVWTFDGTVIGVMSDQWGTLEAATSSFLGAPGTAYPTSENYRGLETGQYPWDGYTVSGNTITVDMRVRVLADWMRVLTAEAPFCFGDLDGDDDIDLADLARLLAQYGETSGMTYEDGDLDEDGDVDLTDLAALLAAYGTTCL